ncbi:hypothetical protein DPMN_090951 [Dreissena polymorpha]|uniref:Uncharacterized protein n=1 Tax=Dreissena polymorpha TaxID=45954 RepID=A0A9D4KYN5_DREPO|nr:hypothetical protein DPMN_090951 [Dreissena polymorpha]
MFDQAKELASLKEKMNEQNKEIEILKKCNESSKQTYEASINDLEQLGKYTPNKNRPVIVKFVRRQTKIDIMKRARNQKGTGTFNNEDLTQTNAEVLASLRLKEPGRVKKAWSFKGKLFVSMATVECVMNLTDFKVPFEKVGEDIRTVALLCGKKVYLEYQHHQL